MEFIFGKITPDRALNFAIEQSKRKKSKIKDPAVIGAVIDLGYCLDLMDMANIVLVKETYHTIRAAADLADAKLPQNTSPATHAHKNDLLFRNPDCLVINSLHVTQDEERPSIRLKAYLPKGENYMKTQGLEKRIIFRFAYEIQIV